MVWRTMRLFYAAKGKPLNDLTGGDLDLSRHFQLHALEGATGAPRWRNAGLDFRKDLDRLEQVPHPSLLHPIHKKKSACASP